VREHGADGWVPEPGSLPAARSQRSHSRGAVGDRRRRANTAWAAGGVHLGPQKTLRDGESFHVERTTSNKAQLRRPRGEPTQPARFSGQNFDGG